MMKRTDWIYIFFLLLISVASHWQWFGFGSVLTFSDWTYWSDESVRQLWNSWGTWVNYWNFGSGNIQLFFNVFKLAWSGFASLGFSYDDATKITFFIPIAVFGFLSPYFLFRKLLTDERIAFVVALFYGTTTYFLLKQAGHLPIALVYALSPLVFLFFIRALEKNTTSPWLRFTLLYWLISVYEVRIAYIFSFVLFVYFVQFHLTGIRSYVRSMLVSMGVFVALSLFWLLPTLLGGLSGDISVATDRGLFGNRLFDIKYALTLFESSWTGGYPDMNFDPQRISPYFLFIPFFLLLSLVTIQFSSWDKRKKNVVIFFLGISLVGIFLTKQAGMPFESMYGWLYRNFPGFSLFREASKFYILTAFGYAGLLGYGLLFMKESWSGIGGRRAFYGACSLISLLSLWNLKPLMTGEMRTLFVPRNIPVDYRVLESELSSRSDYFRTLWIPEQSRWSYYDNEHPKTGMMSVSVSEWKGFIYDERQTKLLSAQRSMSLLFGLPFVDRLSDISSIRYVFVPLRDIANDDDFFLYDGKDKDFDIRQWYIDRLDSVSWLKRIDIGTEDLAVYENEDYRPHIYLTEGEETIREDVPFREVPFEFVNPTEYKVRLENISKPVWVNFSEKYHPGWKVRTGEFRWWKVLWDGSYFLPDSDHMENDAKLNSFMIDPREACGENACRKNPDGSVDMDLTIYFRPQSYFYLGLIISGMALTGSLGYLGRYGVRKLLLSRKKKEE